jgi:hypothetical protein
MKKNTRSQSIPKKILFCSCLNFIRFFNLTLIYWT